MRISSIPLPYTLRPSTDYWALGLIATSVGTIATGINLLVTIIKLRAPGMTPGRIPVFTWMCGVTAFLILALDGAMPNWLAALIVGLVYAAVAGLLYLRGKRRVEEAGSPVPEQTVETLKEDVQWAKHPTTSAKR